MPSLKTALTISLVALAAIAVVNRVPTARRLVYGG